MTESEAQDNDSTQSKADKRIIQVKMASEAAPKKNNSENSDNSDNS